MLVAIIFLALRKRITPILQSLLKSSTLLLLLLCFMLPQISFANNGEPGKEQIENRELAKKSGFKGIRVRTLNNKTHKGYALHTDGINLHMVSFDYKEDYVIPLSSLNFIANKEPEGPISIFYFGGFCSAMGAMFMGYMYGNNSQNPKVIDETGFYVGLTYGLRAGAAGYALLLISKARKHQKYQVGGSTLLSQEALYAFEIPTKKMII